MELQVEQVQRALQAVAGACNARHQSEVLQHVLLQATADGVQVVASDGEVTAIAVVTPESVRPETVPAMEILLPQKFIEIAKQLAADTLRITADDTSLQLTSGGGRWRLATADPQDYPIWASPAGIVGLTLDHVELSDALQGVAFCCDNQSTRYAFGAVRLDYDAGDCLMVVATDGRRLASRAVVASLACTPLIMALIPSKSVKAIRSMQAVGHVLLQVDDRNVYITDQVGNRVIVRQAEGRFPKWRDVVPDGRKRRGHHLHYGAAGDVCASGPDDDRQGVTRRITDD
ncbi:MAG UNVERIFIED_CONTAM: DNA polymerase III subunit beta [Planctomycetaceae bacterium]